MPSSGPSDNDIERFLSNTGVRVYIQDALTMLLENRPEHPIRFLAEYFQAAVKPGSSLSRAYRYIRATPRSRPAFMNNLVSAFVVLDTYKSGVKSCGLTFKDLKRLLRLLANEFPIDVVSPLIGTLGYSDSDLASFEIFHLSIVAILIFEELLEKLEWVFKGCDSESTGCITHSMFKEVIALLKNDQFCSQQYFRNNQDSPIDYIPKKALSYKEFLTLILHQVALLPKQSEQNIRD